jgi:hypothetical protein
MVHVSRRHANIVSSGSGRGVSLEDLKFIISEHGLAIEALYSAVAYLDRGDTCEHVIYLISGSLADMGASHVSSDGYSVEFNDGGAEFSIVVNSWADCGEAILFSKYGQAAVSVRYG